MRLEVADDSEALATQAAGEVARAAREAIAVRGHFAVAFSGGGTPAGMFAALAAADLPWTSVSVFQVDERVAPDGDSDRNLNNLRQQLVEPAGIPEACVHPMPVTDDDLDAAAARYAATLEETCGRPPALDLVHLGLGADGHTASLVPGDPVLVVGDRDVAVTGTYQGRRRLTLTYPALGRARQRLWLVEGADKAGALRQLLDSDPSIPAGRVPQEDTVVFTDRATYDAGG